MAVSLLSCFFLLLLQTFPISIANNLYKSNRLLRSHLLTATEPTAAAAVADFGDIPPTVYFEVTKPIHVPRTKPCEHLVLQHDFGYTYGKPPVLANYTPPSPSHCPSQHFSKIVLEWNATSKGRQFDRIFGVWLGGVELLRSCTAEPRATGVVWNVQKDITRYYSLLLKNQPQVLAVFLGNIVDKTFTGVYHVNVTFYFYPAEENLSYNKPRLNNLVSGPGSSADLILPISRNLPLNDGLWFEIENSTDTASKKFKIPPNVYRAALEVYVSFHENDEFWYGNFPNDYIIANNLTDTPGNGAFREVVVSLDGEVVGAIWPFTVIYTGGFNPLLWRPITGIGSFNLPSYDIEITPFLGSLLDGETHKLEFSVTNALNVWYVDANLHLWLDNNSTKTVGMLLKHDSKPLALSSLSKFQGLSGTFLTSAYRYILSEGWVKSSHGKVTTRFGQEFRYNNSIELGKGGNLQIVNQTINFNDGVSFKKLSSNACSFKSVKNFHFDVFSANLDQGNDTVLSVTNLTLGFNEKKSKNEAFGFGTSYLQNLQSGQGVMVVKNNLVLSGVGSTQQVYQYDNNKFCFFRNISSSNYTILHDEVADTCHKSEQSQLDIGLNRWWPFPNRRTFLASDLPNSGGVR